MKNKSFNYYIYFVASQVFFFCFKDADNPLFHLISYFTKWCNIWRVLKTAMHLFFPWEKRACLLCMVTDCNHIIKDDVMELIDQKPVTLHGSECFVCVIPVMVARSGIGPGTKDPADIPLCWESSAGYRRLRPWAWSSLNGKLCLGCRDHSPLWRGIWARRAGVVKREIGRNQLSRGGVSLKIGT